MEKEKRKIVLIGGPSSGKTTLIKELEKRGYNVIHEVARSVIEKRLHIPAIRPEIEIRQRLIYEKQLQEEEGCSGLTFLDRGTLDGISYSEHLLGHVPFEVSASDYQMIFNLERLPFVDDGLRVESGDEEAQILHEKILKIYREHGYELVYVPVFDASTMEESVSRRVEYILSKIN